MVLQEKKAPDGAASFPILSRRRDQLSPIALLLTTLILLESGLLLGSRGAEDASDSILRESPFPFVQTSPSALPEPPVDLSALCQPQAPPPPAEWNLLLVSRDSPLPDDFAAPALTQLKNGHAVDSRVYSALQDMLDAARAAGHSPVVCSSYRSQEKQAELFERKVRTYLHRGYGQSEAEELAAAWVSPPGTSEHQAGLAVDIVDMDYQLLNEYQEDRPVQQWLMEHCAEYGFILRYPAGKSDLTGVDYEPWHYRYVGVEAAQKIMEEGLCLEEYLASLAP